MCAVRHEVSEQHSGGVDPWRCRRRFFSPLSEAARFDAIVNDEVAHSSVLSLSR